MKRKRQRAGGYSTSYIGSKVQHDPAWAKAEILEAVDRSRGRLISAAVELGVERRQLQRFCWLLGIWPAVDAIRERWRLGQADTPVLRLLGSKPGLTPQSRAIIRAPDVVPTERPRAAG